MSAIVLSAEEETIVDEGEAANLLLSNPLFLKAIEKVRADCAEAILTSDPSAQKVRDDAYNLSRGLTAITEELDALAARAEQVLAEAALRTEDLVQDSPDEHPSDY